MRGVFIFSGPKFVRIEFDVSEKNVTVGAAFAVTCAGIVRSHISEALRYMQEAPKLLTGVYSVFVRNRPYAPYRASKIYVSV